MADGLAQDGSWTRCTTTQGACGVATENSRRQRGRRPRAGRGLRRAQQPAVERGVFAVPDRDGSMWVATRRRRRPIFAGNRIERFQRRSGLPDAPAFHFLQDAKMAWCTSAPSVAPTGGRECSSRRCRHFAAAGRRAEPRPGRVRASCGWARSTTACCGCRREQAPSIASAASAACPTTTSPRSWSIARGIWARNQRRPAAPERRAVQHVERRPGPERRLRARAGRIRDSSLWVGTSRGLNRIRNGSWKPATPAPTACRTIRSSCWRIAMAATAGREPTTPACCACAATRSSRITTTQRHARQQPGARARTGA